MFTGLFSHLRQPDHASSRRGLSVICQSKWATCDPLARGTRKAARELGGRRGGMMDRAVVLRVAVVGPDYSGGRSHESQRRPRDHRQSTARKLAPNFGVKSLALFGSVVRDEATAASDVDLLVEFDGRPVGLFHLSRTQHYLETILGVPRVDLVLRDGIKPALRERILREAIRAG